MTTTGPADVVMAACSRAVAGPLVPARPGFRELVSVWPASGEPTVARAVFPGSASFKPAVDRMTGRSRPRQPDPRNKPASAWIALCDPRIRIEPNAAMSISPPSPPNCSAELP